MFDFTSLCSSLGVTVCVLESARRVSAVELRVLLALVATRRPSEATVQKFKNLRVGACLEIRANCRA